MTSSSPQSITSSAAVPDRRRRLIAPLGAGLALAGLVLALGLRDPHREGSWGICPFAALTGIPCPGCGGLRAVHHLTELNLVEALSSNAFAVLLLLALVVGWLIWMVSALRDTAMPRWLRSPWIFLVIIVAMLAFGALRLTAWGSWFMP